MVFFLLLFSSCICKLTGFLFYALHVCWDKSNKITGLWQLTPVSSAFKLALALWNPELARTLSRTCSPTSLLARVHYLFTFLLGLLPSAAEINSCSIFGQVDVLLLKLNLKGSSWRTFEVAFYFYFIIWPGIVDILRKRLNDK